MSSPPLKKRRPNPNHSELPATTTATFTITTARIHPFHFDKNDIATDSSPTFKLAQEENVYQTGQQPFEPEEELSDSQEQDQYAQFLQSLLTPSQCDSEINVMSTQNHENKNKSNPFQFHFHSPPRNRKIRSPSISLGKCPSPSIHIPIRPPRNTTLSLLTETTKANYHTNNHHTNENEQDDDKTENDEDYQECEDWEDDDDVGNDKEEKDDEKETKEEESWEDSNLSFLQPHMEKLKYHPLPLLLPNIPQQDSQKQDSNHLPTDLEEAKKDDPTSYHHFNDPTQLQRQETQPQETQLEDTHTNSDHSSSVLDLEEDWITDPNDLEEELKGLLQEDFEATIFMTHSFTNTHGITHHNPENIESSNDNNNDDNDNNNKNPMSSKNLLDPQRPRFHSQTFSCLSPTTIHTASAQTPTAQHPNPSPLTPNSTTRQRPFLHSLACNTPQTMFTTATTGTPAGTAAATTALSKFQTIVPTQTQWNKLQKLMSKQYQLLLQQAVLAVRSAHSNKVQKEGPIGPLTMNHFQPTTTTITTHDHNHKNHHTITNQSIIAPASLVTKNGVLPFSSSSSSYLPSISTQTNVSHPLTAQASSRWMTQQGTSMNTFNFPTSGTPLPLPTSSASSSSLPLTSSSTHVAVSCTPPHNKKKQQHDFFLSGETPDELAEILDGAVGMLQDLEQNWKDALRYSIQMQGIHKDKVKRKNNRNHTLDASMKSSTTTQDYSDDRREQENTLWRTKETVEDPMLDPQKQKDLDECPSGQERMLTRSAFSRRIRKREFEDYTTPPTNTAQSTEAGENDVSISERTSPVLMTTFDVKGLGRLYETFAAIDNSVNSYPARNMLGRGDELKNILEPIDHGYACELLLRHARSDYESILIPMHQDILDVFTYPLEIVEESTSKLSREVEIQIRRNRNLFTSAEDNLLLRGVNLYGEKEWSLISDRFLPDRAVAVISQRYAKLCVLLYKAHNIKIDESGNLITPPEHPNGVEDFDETAISLLKPVQAPAVINVHRWSLEEDVTLLKAVPLMGHMWAEIAGRLIPHRDRGHLRKRYQVLERRVKATVKREKKTSLIFKGNLSALNTKSEKKKKGLSDVNTSDSANVPLPTERNESSIPQDLSNNMNPEKIPAPTVPPTQGKKPRTYRPKVAQKPFMPTPFLPMPQSRANMTGPLPSYMSHGFAHGSSHASPATGVTSRIPLSTPSNVSSSGRIMNKQSMVPSGPNAHHVQGSLPGQTPFNPQLKEPLQTHYFPLSSPLNMASSGSMPYTPYINAPQLVRQSSNYRGKKSSARRLNSQHFALSSAHTPFYTKGNASSTARLPFGTQAKISSTQLRNSSIKTPSSNFPSFTSQTRAPSSTGIPSTAQSNMPESDKVAINVHGNATSSAPMRSSANTVVPSSLPMSLSTTDNTSANLPSNPPKYVTSIGKTPSNAEANATSLLSINQFMSYGHGYESVNMKNPMTVKTEQRLPSSPSVREIQPESLNSPASCNSRPLELSSIFADGTSRMSHERLLDSEGWSQFWKEKNSDHVRQDNKTTGSEAHDNSASTDRNEDLVKDQFIRDNTNLPLIDIENSRSGITTLKSTDFSFLQGDTKQSTGSIKKRPRRIMSTILGRRDESLSAFAKDTDSRPPSSFESSSGMMLGIMGFPSSIMASGSAASIDGLNFSNFSVAEDSTQHAPDTGRLGYSTMSSPGPFDGHSLMPTEFDAITVLNQMSNSNVSFGKDCNSIGCAATDTSDRVEGSKMEKASLFAQVIRGVRNKDGKKKV